MKIAFLWKFATKPKTEKWIKTRGIIIVKQAAWKLEQQNVKYVWLWETEEKNPGANLSFAFFSFLIYFTTYFL